MVTSRLEIDLSAVDRNLGIIRGVLADPPLSAAGRSKTSGGGRGPVAVCAVLKQDGYGLGAVRMAKRLVGGRDTGGAGLGGGAGGVEMIAVYTLDEARVIAESVANVPILVLMPVTGIDRMDPVYRHLTGGRIHLTLHSDDQLRQLAEMSVRIGATLPLHVQVDTGLSRGGSMPEQARKLVERLIATPRAKLSGLMTHFASPCCDGPFTREQARLFRDFVESIKPVLKAAVTSAAGGGAGGGSVSPHELSLHASNSCAMFRARSYHGTMVRVGQAMLGFALEDLGSDERSVFEFGEAAARLEPVMRWTTTIAHIGEIPAGWPVGYGSVWRAPWRADGKMTRIALVPVGYADGYPRALGGRGTGGPGYVGLTGRAWVRKSGGESDDAGATEGARRETLYAPVVGRVSMDQITIDVTDIPEQYLTGSGPIGALDAGPEVELFSKVRGAPNFISTMAGAAGSITHEQLCRIGARVERTYRYPATSATGGMGGGGLIAPVKFETVVPSIRPTPARDGRSGEGMGGIAALAQ